MGGRQGLNFGLAAALTIWVGLAPLNLPAADDGLSVRLGPARIQLLKPDGLIPIDGLDQAVDELLAGLTAPGAEILAVYAEPRSWSAYKKGINREGPRVALDFYAYIATPVMPPEEMVNQADFERFKELTLQYGGGLQVLDNQPRYLTYQVASTQLNDDGRQVWSNQITTLILVEGKILALNTFSNNLNRVPSQFVPSALTWRDAYWKLTRPGGAASGSE